MTNAVSVSQAADILGVHVQRIHQRIREGSLPAEKIGNQWVVRVADLNRIASRTAPGRPLSAKSSWALLAAAAGHPEALSSLSAPDRSRAHSRLRTLLAAIARDVEVGDLDAIAAHLSHALRNRADRRLYFASPTDLADILEDARVRLGGVSSPGSNMSAADVVEAYVEARDREGLVEDYLLSSASPERANVILHAFDSASLQWSSEVVDQLIPSRLALAADLAEHDGVREKNEALNNLLALREGIAAPAAPADRSKA